MGCSIAGIWGLYQIRMAKNQSAAASNLHYEFQEIRLLFERSLMGPHDYIIHGNKLEKEIFSKDYKNLISKINDLKNLIISNKANYGYEFEKILGVVENQLLIIENELPAFKSIALDIFGLKMYPGDSLPGSKMEEMDFFVRRLEDHLRSEGSILLSLSNKATKRIDDVQIYIFILLIIFSANALLIGMLLSFYITRNISSSIDGLIQVTRKIKEGDLTVRAEIKSNDEIAELADSFNEMLNELADTQNRMSSIFHGSGDGMCVIDDNFNILQINREMEDMVGVHEIEVVGKKCYEIFHGELCHTDRCTLKCILSGEKWIELETDKETMGGEKKPVELIATPFKRRGETIGVIESFRDITKRKKAEDGLKRAYDDLEMRVKERTSMLANVNKELQSEIRERETAEEALRREEEKFYDLYQEAPIAYLSLQRNGIIDDCNRKTEEFFGYKRKELIGTNIIDLFSDTQKEKEKGKEILNRFISGNIIYSEKIHLANKDGSLIWGSMTINAVRDQEGNMISIRCMIVDITKHVNMEDQLMQAQRMESIGTLAGGIAHDFNNLLMGIQGNVSLMQINMDIVHPYYKRLKNIEQQVQSGARLTSHLLGFARKGKYEIKPININRLIEDTSDTFGQTRKEITIYNELAEDLFIIEADQSQIETVLLNLYTNAADAMHGVGDFIIKTMNVTCNDIKSSLFKPKHENYIMLMVTDTGTGMDKSTIEHIFDPFFTTKEIGRGTGLGLSSVYGIIKSHDGYIDVESKKGHGTTFKVYIPASEKEIEKVFETSEFLVRGTETVLLVDDETIILEVGKDLLEAIGCKVLTATNGKDAIEVYKKKYKEIDIVILDMIMPHMDGGEAYNRMKEINPDIKVLLSSGYSIDGQAADIIKRGCNGFIQKPFNIKELSKKIREIVA